MITVKAMPQFIPALSEKYKNKYLSWAQAAYANKGKSRRLNKLLGSKLPASYTLWHYVRGKLHFFFYVKDDKVVVLHVSEIRVFGRVTRAAENLVIRLGGEPLGAIYEVFFDYVLPYHGFVVTDYQYTADGHRFFQNVYREALTRRAEENVCWVFNADGSAPQQIENVAAFNAVCEQLFGEDKVFKTQLFAIQQKGWTP